MFVNIALVRTHVLWMAEMSEASDEVPPSKRRKYCDHCLKFVGYSTYYKHREQFLDPVTNQWSVDLKCSTQAGACESSDSSTNTSQDSTANNDGNGVNMNFQGFESRNEGRSICIIVRGHGSASARVLVSQSGSSRSVIKHGILIARFR